MQCNAHATMSSLEGIKKNVIKENKNFVEKMNAVSHFNEERYQISIYVA